MNTLVQNSVVFRAISAQVYPRLLLSHPLAAVTGFYFAFRILCVLLSVRIFNQDASVGVGISLGLNYLLLLAAVLQSIGPAHQDMTSIYHLPVFRWVIVFFVFTGISLSWSLTASLPAALAFWGAMASDAAIVVLLLRMTDANSVASSLMAGYVWGTCAVALIAWLLPAQSDLRLGDEELIGPNQIGWVCAIAFFFSQYLNRMRRQNWTIPAALLAVTVLRSLSKTTIVAFVAGQAYILLRDESITRKTRIVLAVFALLVVVTFSGLLINYYNIYINAGTESETLTGRLGIWAFFASEAIEKPWLGHGFHSVWKVVPPFYDGFEARHAHNEVLQQFYAYGVAGIVMLFALYSSVAFHVRRLSDQSLRTFFFAMLVFVLVRGLADTEAFDLSLPMWLIVIIGALIENARQANSRIVIGVLA